MHLAGHALAATRAFWEVAPKNLLSAPAEPFPPPPPASAGAEPWPGRGRPLGGR